MRGFVYKTIQEGLVQLNEAASHTNNASHQQKVIDIDIPLIRGPDKDFNSGKKTLGKKLGKLLGFGSKKEKIVIGQPCNFLHKSSLNQNKYIVDENDPTMRQMLEILFSHLNVEMSKENIKKIIDFANNNGGIEKITEKLDNEMKQKEEKQENYVQVKRPAPPTPTGPPVPNLPVQYIPPQIPTQIPVAPPPPPCFEGLFTPPKASGAPFPPPPAPDLTTRLTVAAPKTTPKPPPVVVSEGHDNLLDSIRNHQFEKKERQERQVSPKRREIAASTSAPSMFAQLMNVLDQRRDYLG